MCFYVHFKNVLKHINDICYYSSQFMNFLEGERILDNNVLFITLFETNIL